MNRTKTLGAAAVAVAMLVGVSAFADSRPQRRTYGGGGRIQRGGGGGGAPRATERPRRDSIRQGEARTERGNRSYDRNRNSRDPRGSRDRYQSFDERRYRSGGRESDYNRRYDQGRSQHYRGNAYWHHGRVSRCARYGNGYRVWIVGAPYPYYVPLAYWDPWRFRVGVSIGLGGYYNPLGYYDYYDGYNDGYRAGSYRGYDTVELTGYVEDYDARRGTALVRDDVTDRLVTVSLRGRDARYNRIRRGDYIELEGSWRGGIFEAYRIFDID